MRLTLALTIVFIATLASPLAYGQAPLGKPSRPIAAPPTKPGAPPPNDALSNLAGGGYADPNYVPPGVHSKKPSSHRATRAPHRTVNLFVGYTAYKAFPYRFCGCYCDY